MNYNESPIAIQRMKLNLLSIYRTGFSNPQLLPTTVAVLENERSQGSSPGEGEYWVRAPKPYPVGS